jgi:ABC-2 type transport system ATP-binding protein
MNNTIAQLHEVIDLQNIAKSYRQKKVLAGATLSIPKGSVLGLLGTNGSGKTTLLKIALGLIRPDAGQSSIFTEDSWNLSANAKERIGYVPQVANLFPWLKVHHVIQYIASFYANWNDDLVERLINDWEIPREDRVGKMSVGQQQKLAILLAIAHEPEVLILDEPAASLDPLARRKFLQLIIDLAAPGERTILFSSHITSDLERVADRVAILKGGRIAYSGLLDDLKEDVKRVHVASHRMLPQHLDIPGTIHERITGSEAVLSINGLDSETIDNIKSNWDADVDVQNLNLEDIFLEMHNAGDEK